MVALLCSADSVVSDGYSSPHVAPVQSNDESDWPIPSLVSRNRHTHHVASVVPGHVASSSAVVHNTRYIHRVEEEPYHTMELHPKRFGNPVMAVLVAFGDTNLDADDAATMHELDSPFVVVVADGTHSESASVTLPSLDVNG